MAIVAPVSDRRDAGFAISKLSWHDGVPADMATFLITGASGKTGREVLASLTMLGIDARPASRATGFDFLDRSSWSDHLAGVRSVFLLRPPAIADIARTLAPFVAAARASGVDHIVFLSVAGADRLRFLPHAAVERALLADPRDWTILRPGFFAQNFEDACLHDIRTADRILLPAGKGRVAFVDLRDVGALAASLLAVPDEHRGQAYHLTGPVACTFDHAAAVLTRLTGRRITYRRASVLGYLRHLRRQGLSLGQAVVQTALHTGLRFGQAEAVDGTLGRLLGRPTRDIDAYLTDHAALFGPLTPNPGSRAGATPKSL